MAVRRGEDSRVVAAVFISGIVLVVGSIWWMKGPALAALCLGAALVAMAFAAA